MADDKEAIKRMADHVGVLNDEVGAIQVDVGIIKTDVSWLKKMQFWLLGLIASGLVVAVGYAWFNGS